MKVEVVFYTVSIIGIVYLTANTLYLRATIRRNDVLYKFCQLRRDFIKALYDKRLSPQSIIARVYLTFINDTIHYFDMFRKHFTIVNFYRAIKKSKEEIKYRDQFMQIMEELKDQEESVIELVARFHVFVYQEIFESNFIARIFSKVLFWGLTNPLIQRASKKIFNENRVNFIEETREEEISTTELVRVNIAS